MQTPSLTEYLETEVLILGSGIAGATAALELADRGVQVTVATRATQPEDSNTLWAQGGIIYNGEHDSPADLAQDILRAGAGHSYPKAVAILAEEGPPTLKRVLLERVGVEFDRTDDGELSLALEGGHSMPRILHVADYTGKAIELALVKALQAHPKITLLTGHTAVDLLTPSHHSLNRLAIYEHRSCVGAYLFDQASGQVRRCLARETILATGGLGQIFLRTTNPAGARGDGVAMAQRAQARVINLEFVQFHPTTFYHVNAPNLLISEAVRGAGARLVNADGEPFMQRYQPEWKDLAPRDVVARSIHQEMLANDLTHVYLDLRSYVSQDEILHHFPTIRESLLPYGVDITQRSGAGGAGCALCLRRRLGGRVGPDDDCGISARSARCPAPACTAPTGWPARRCWKGWCGAAGRLAYIVENLPPALTIDPADIPPWRDDGLEAPDPALISQDMASIKHIMWNYVGLARTTRRLDRALSELYHLETEIESFYRTIKLTDGLIGLRNAVRTAILTASAAWQNKRSMGAHFRE